MYTFTGNTKLDVPANGRRDYRAVFHCYKESTFNFTVAYLIYNKYYELPKLNYFLLGKLLQVFNSKIILGNIYQSRG